MSWHLGLVDDTWAMAMVGGDDVAPTSLNEGRGSRWLGGSRRRKVLMWCDLKKIQHATWFITKTNIFGHMTDLKKNRFLSELNSPHFWLSVDISYIARRSEVELPLRKFHVQRRGQACSCSGRRL